MTKQATDFCSESKKPDFENLVMGVGSVDGVVFFANDDGSAVVTDCGCTATAEAFLPLTFDCFLLTNLGID
jgi:hypothetical protein